jgi:hypothetical protein
MGIVFFMAVSHPPPNTQKLKPGSFHMPNPEAMIEILLVDIKLYAFQIETIRKVQFDIQSHFEADLSNDPNGDNACLPLLNHVAIAAENLSGKADQIADLISLDLDHPEIGIEPHLAGQERLDVTGLYMIKPQFEATFAAVGLVEDCLRCRSVEPFQSVAKTLPDEYGAGLDRAFAHDGSKSAGREYPADQGGDEEL